MPNGHTLINNYGTVHLLLFMGVSYFLEKEHKNIQVHDF